MFPEQAFFGLGIFHKDLECKLISWHPSTIEVVLIFWEDKALAATNEQINEFWTNWLETHPNDVNNSIASLAKIDRTNKKLTLFVRPKPFSVHLFGLNTRNNGLKFTTRCLDDGNALALSVGAITLTLPSAEYPQGCIIFSKRKNTALNCGEYTLLPSGYIDPTKDWRQEGDKKYIIDPLHTLNKECKEELPGLSRYKKPKAIGLIYTQAKQPMIVFTMQILFDTDKAKSILSTRKADFEVENYMFVPADTESLKMFLQNNKVCADARYRLALWLSDSCS